VTYYEALAIYVQRHAGLTELPVVVMDDFENGGDVQIGDEIWDHDNALVTVTYVIPPSEEKAFYSIDLEYIGFGTLVTELAEIMNGVPTNGD
jgi:hypothetical protein